MTKEQYEKLKEYIEAVVYQYKWDQPEATKRKAKIEKELDTLMFPEGEE